jgi:hypothetical protein
MSYVPNYNKLRPIDEGSDYFDRYSRVEGFSDIQEANDYIKWVEEVNYVYFPRCRIITTDDGKIIVKVTLAKSCD